MSKNSSTTTLFVYGTLLPGMGRYHILQNARALGNARMSGATLHDLGPYPGIVLGRGQVFGECFEVGPDLLARLDGVEGNRPGRSDGLYQRCPVTIQFLKDGRKGPAQTYTYKQDLPGASKTIPHGDYRRHLAENAPTQWYLAYGSNLDPIRLHERIGSVKRSIPCRMPGYRLVFTKRKGSTVNSYANMEFVGGDDGGSRSPHSLHPNGEGVKEIVDVHLFHPLPLGEGRGEGSFHKILGCPCVLYEVTSEQLAILDRHESVATNQYVRIALPVECEGQTLLAQTYLAHPEALVTGARPTPEYMGYIKNGYKAWGLGEI